MRVAITAALLLITLSGVARANDETTQFCVLRSEALADFNNVLNEYERITGEHITKAAREATVAAMLATIPTRYHIIETKADCPKGTQIFHPSSLNPSGHTVEDND